MVALQYVTEDGPVDVKRKRYGKPKALLQKAEDSLNNSAAGLAL